MKRLFGASLTTILATAAAVPALAAGLPEVKVNANNQVPVCATPGRMMELVRMRNPGVSHRFDTVATEYMRHGEELGIRWDMAFFQMVLETGALSFTGDVRPDQNNFAGLGASGGGKRGERFSDVSSGVKAHLQHLLMYAGEHVDDPVAERTRKVQEWGVLTDWQQSISGPMTFSLIGQQWAPGSRNYVRDIAAIKDEFYSRVCNAPDPNPEYVQEARKGRLTQTQVATATPAASQPEASKVSGAEVAKKSIEQARNENPPRSALGVGLFGNVAASAKAAADKAAAEQQAKTQKPPAATKSQAALTVLNASEPEKKADAPQAKPDTGASIQTASVAGAATKLKTPQANKSDKCKVWTASYGGQQAIIIKATSDGTDNYTVLDVNEASMKREVDAYIAAYAKGGQQIGSFKNQTQALDKAFELCPEG